jgi:hypothetical protein
VDGQEFIVRDEVPNKKQTKTTDKNQQPKTKQTRRKNKLENLATNILMNTDNISSLEKGIFNI